MNDEARITDLRNDLSALNAQASNHYLLLREISTILGTVSSTLASANQISAHERESLLSKLEAISSEIVQERRDMSGFMSRIERALETMNRDFEDRASDLEEASDKITEIHLNTQNIASQVGTMNFNLAETLKHAREMVERDPETGVRVSRSDRLIKGLLKLFWSCLGMAFVLLGLSKIIPWIRGLHAIAP